jgi:mRNA interferase RelE/StbE
VRDQPYRLKFTPAALRELEKLDSFIRRKVFSDIVKLAGDPRPPGVQMLESKDKLYRLHIGPGKNFRVVYEIHDAVLLVLVVRIGDRKEVYRRIS